MPTVSAACVFVCSLASFFSSCCFCTQKKCVGFYNQAKKKNSAITATNTTRGTITRRGSGETNMFLTPRILPMWLILITALTYSILRANDPVDLTQYQKKMRGIPLTAACLSPLLPFCVWGCYEAIRTLGPKGSKVAIKVYD
ncbi:hypothetical protein TRSC58_07163 [Trypanosoma rangeli SC58]|uniref:Uncharacterized protein n=1 Tax=Trypanosoma rangeli SC58 TaxID=429131 RepID=A0A061IW14_TRYRA|nr:hypothetical protein TRSC58_07163 [Trypanosoma rangeli SC58]